MTREHKASRDPRVRPELRDHRVLKVTRERKGRKEKKETLGLRRGRRLPVSLLYLPLTILSSRSSKAAPG